MGATQRDRWDAVRLDKSPDTRSLGGLPSDLSGLQSGAGSHRRGDVIGLQVGLPDVVAVQTRQATFEARAAWRFSAY